MDTVVHVLGVVALFAFSVLALATLIVGLPGTFIIVATAFVYAWATGFTAVTWTTIGWLLGLAVFAEGLELVSATLGSGSERPSRKVAMYALTGGIIGGVVGTPFFFGVGSLLGALGGAFGGAALATSSEGAGVAVAIRNGFAALRGRLLGFIVKAAIGVVMLVVLFAAVL